MLWVVWYLLSVLLALFLLAFGFLCTFGAIPSLRKYRLLKNFPGPKGIFFFGSIFEVMGISEDEILVWLENHLKRYERLMVLWAIGICNIYLKDPKDIQLLLNSTDNITKGNEYALIKDWLKEGLLLSTGAKWHSRRKILTPAFHFKILEDTMTIFNKNAKILSKKLEENNNKDIIMEEFITLCTLDVIMGAAMGVNIEAQITGGDKYVRSVKKLSEITMHRMVSPHLYNRFTFYLSWTGREFRKALHYLHEFTNAVIKEKKSKYIDDNESSFTGSLTSSGKILKAFLDRMLEYDLKNPGSFADSGIQEEVDTFMFEGHDTTSAGLIFIFYSLAKYQDIQTKVYEELQDIFDNSDRDTTTEDLHKMTYLDKVIKECLRLYPSVPAISRLLDKDLILDDGLIIPANCNVVIPTYIVHRNEKYWKNPEDFDPERFSEEQLSGRHPYAYIPFSAGQRNCIGQKFALMELKTVVSTVIRGFKIYPVTKDEDLNLVIFLILRSTTPIKCKFVKR